MTRFLLLLMAVCMCMAGRAADAVPGVITIPVVVHVLYNNTQQNISDAQIQSQLEVLNRDYRGTNADKGLTPAYFLNLAADCGFAFQLAKTDPKGFATSGIIRKFTSIQYFGTDDRAKNAALGGDVAWDRNQYLNIWVCNLTGGVLGYTSAVGCAAEKDGVVINYTAFGTTGTASYPFNGGRTATHEIGHWLNLRHLWGDTYCGDDGVDDTPTQRASNKGSLSGEKFSCGTTAHGDMYMNFMDLTNDACMHLFTKGQRDRMQALFQAGGARTGILSSKALQAATAVHSTQPAAATTEIASSALKAYPNPAINSLVIELDQAEGLTGGWITVYNVGGQPVISLLLSANRTTLDVSHLAAGLYFIRQKNSNAVTRFLKH